VFAPRCCVWCVFAICSHVCVCVILLVCGRVVRDEMLIMVFAARCVVIRAWSTNNTCVESCVVHASYSCVLWCETASSYLCMYVRCQPSLFWFVCQLHVLTYVVEVRYCQFSRAFRLCGILCGVVRRCCDVLTSTAYDEPCNKPGVRTGLHGLGKLLCMSCLDVAVRTSLFSASYS